MSGGGKKILYVGHWTKNHDYQKYFARVAEELAKSNILFGVVSLDGVPEADGEGNITVFKMQRVHALPHIVRVHVPEDLLDEAVEIERSWRSGTRDEFRSKLSALYENFFFFLKVVQPELILLGHQFGGRFRILREVCDRLEVPVAFVHPGVLPATICFEEGGQMAESWIGRDPEAFRGLAISEEELARAEAFVEHLSDTSYIRQSHASESSAEELESFQEWARGDVPVVFFAGCCDPLTGLSPRTYAHSSWHSPYAESSLDGLKRTLNVCQSLGWKVVFKAHPKLRTEIPRDLCESEQFRFAKRLMVQDLLRECDAVVTPVSQASYEALILGKPVVLMGRLQLNGSGSVYEALAPEALEPALQSALSDGFTYEMRAHFVRHVALLNRYYLFGLDRNAEAFLSRWEGEAAAFLAAACGGRSPCVSRPGRSVTRSLLALDRWAHSITRRVSA